jgi:hypothetical protein
MTLIVAIQTKADEIVVAADRRLMFVKTDRPQSIRKLIRLGQLSVGSIHGTPRSVRADNPRKADFDAYAVMRKFFKRREVDEVSVEAFAAKLESVFATYIRDVRHLTALNEGRFLFTVVIYMLHHGHVRRYRLTFLSSASAAIITHTTEPKQFGDSRFQGFGEVGMIVELRSGHDATLDDLRSRVDVASVVMPLTCPLGTVDEEGAIALCKLMIARTSAFLDVRNGGRSGVSPECDVAVIDVNGCRLMGSVSGCVTVALLIGVLIVFWSLIK